MSRITRLVIIALGLARPLPAQHELGRVAFPTSCNAAAQREFERAMTYLHSFWWEQGLSAFQAVVSADSTCAMGYWGLALNAWGNPFAGGAPPTSESARRGALAAQRAAALGAPTPREQGFIAAAAALYRGYDSTPNTRRLLAYSDTLARVYRDFANDTEVAIYYALSLVATAPKTDTTFARQKRAAAILNPLFQRFPTHPGLAHYIIHANDSPQLAALVRRGLWDETIAANQRAFQAGVDYARAQHTGVAPEQIHALDYMVYAYLQEGRDTAARRTVTEALALQTTLANDALVANYNRVAMEARLPLERGDWAAAAQLPVRSSGMTIGAALSHFAVKGAADIEDVTEKQPITPGELLPARELEGDMLLAIGRAADARAAYEASLAREPNRARSLYGSARADELAGDKPAARLRYAAFLTQMGAADGDRVEIARARAALR